MFQNFSGWQLNVKVNRGNKKKKTRSNNENIQEVNRLWLFIMTAYPVKMQLVPDAQEKKVTL